MELGLTSAETCVATIWQFNWDRSIHCRVDVISETAGDCIQGIKYTYLTPYYLLLLRCKHIRSKYSRTGISCPYGAQRLIVRSLKSSNVELGQYLDGISKLISRCAPQSLFPCLKVFLAQTLTSARPFFHYNWLTTAPFFHANLVGQKKQEQQTARIALSSY